MDNASQTSSQETHASQQQEEETQAPEVVIDKQDAAPVAPPVAECCSACGQVKKVAPPQPSLELKDAV